MFVFKKINTTGLTLLEVLAAISILTILVAIGFPALTRTLPGLRLTDAARQVATELYQVRMKAIAQGIPHQIAFSSGSYVLQRCNGACVNDGGNIALPQGITAVSTTPPRFESRGTLNTAASITLSNGSAQKYVCVKTVGRVNIQDATCS